MTGTDTIRMLSVYEQEVARPRYISTWFETPADCFHDSTTVEYDIIRNGQDIAVPVPSAESGPRLMEETTSVNKGWTPITFKYESRISAGEVKKRLAGQDPYTDPAAGVALSQIVFRRARKLENMLRDAVEELCSQVVQTGTITAADDANQTVAGPYNFFPLDASGTLASGDLIVTTGTEWAADGATGDPIGDLLTLSNNMRDRGYNPTQAIFGQTAWQRFLANTKVKDHANFRRVNLIDVNPTPAPEGATRQGMYAINDYAYEFFTYNGTYKKPYGGTITPYLAVDKVVLRAPTPGGLRLTFGEIDYFEQARDARALPYLPRMQFNSPSTRFGMTMYAYFTPDQQTLVISCGTRVLPIPVAIDSFACIDMVP
jgi:hypothetical protein